MLVKRKMLKIRRLASKGKLAQWGFISANQAQKIGLDNGFVVILSLLQGKQVEPKFTRYKLSDDIGSEYGIETDADLSSIDQSIIDAIGVAVGNIYDAAVNYDEKTAYEDEREDFERTNLMFIDIETGHAYDSNLNEAVGWA
ncbi:hypothetical protein EHF38_18985 (plasmid) [Acinetobacter baumannii]|uniref:hypothetical protein n=1 Tax=Acinetobacter baumannii TaxID=470 RepID=UPI000FEC3D47|nr:hypothetical protein [Acinetobacter baumannii]QAB42448.1 hypothetical protein EHF38_18985 [Acinetobacter baumannii]